MRHFTKSSQVHQVEKEGKVTPSLLCMALLYRITLIESPLSQVHEAVSFLWLGMIKV